MANVLLTISLPFDGTLPPDRQIAGNKGGQILSKSTPRKLYFTLFSSLVCTALLPGIAAARSIISLDSTVFVERSGARNGRLLEPAARLSHGDKVVYVVNWTRASGSGGFIVTNPLPRTVYYQDSASDDAEVSVDGGHTWGALDRLRVGSRIATPEDVTHVRWRIPAQLAAQGSGQIAYSAIVR